MQILFMTEQHNNLYFIITVPFLYIYALPETITYFSLCLDCYVFFFNQKINPKPFPTSFVGFIFK